MTVTNLVDVSSISLDNTIPLEQRAVRIFEMVKDPYCFRVGDMGVKLEFSYGAPSLQDKLTAFLLHKKSGF